MYLFNRITVNPQLPKRISKLATVANNLWWSWNTEFLRLFQRIDMDLWEQSNKNPVKFLKHVSQEKLEDAAKDVTFLKEYDKIVEEFEDYMNSKNTWFSKNYPEEKGDLIAYFSAEYGLDQTIPIYSGGLGILSGDHLKSASDLGIPLVAVGLLYKDGYFNQKIDGEGQQQCEYNEIDLYDLPINPVKNEVGEDLIIYVKFPKRRLYLKVWSINVGRIKLYLLDSDIEKNNPEDRDVTLKLYGGDQEMRIRQEIVLGQAGVELLTKYLKLNPTVYHMNEGHSAFLTLEIIKNIIAEKQVSFEVAKDITSSKTVFTTHTPVPAGNDIFPLDLVERYFKDFWPRLGLSREEFLKLGMKPVKELENGFNMGILALKIAGKKIDGIVIYPGEVFSLWNLVGKTSKRKGYLEGLTINDSELGKGRGGGLCQLGNLIHYLVLHTDLEVIEKHHHSDALFPDEKRRVPFGTGTSIAYKKLDYKFKNTLDCPVQLRIWQDDKMIYGEIRGTKPISYKYRLVEEDSHFAMEDGIFYRNSKVYRIKTDKETGKDIKKELILDNHSRVMYDYDLIPKDQIRENNYVKQDYK